MLTSGCGLLPLIIGEYIAIPGKVVTVFERTNPPRLLINIADNTGIQPLYSTDFVVGLRYDKNNHKGIRRIRQPHRILDTSIVSSEGKK